MPDCAVRSPQPIRQRQRWPRRGGAVLAVLAAGCAQPPPAPSDRVERFADAYVQLLPIGRVMDMAAAGDARWPLGDKAALVSSAQLACMRATLSSAAVTPSQRQTARDYAQAHAPTLADDLHVLESGAARLLGEAMLSGADSARKNALASASPSEIQALTRFLTEPRFAELRRATGLDRLGANAAPRGTHTGQPLLVKAMTGAFLGCHIPVKLLY